MKIREKKYLFEGFLNVFVITLIGLMIGFAMGSFMGILVGINSAVQKQLDLCLKYPQYQMEECTALYGLPEKS